MELTRVDIQALYDRYGHVVYGRCRSLLGDEQEAYDALQEVFVRLLRNADQLRGEASPMTWLYRVSTNLCLNRIRDQKSRARKLSEPDPAADSPPGMSGFAQVDPDRRKLVQALLERVDEETRAIVIYYFVDEMTLEEIASLVELSVPTLRKRIQHFQGVARRTLAISPAGAGTVIWLVFQLAGAGGLPTGLLPRASDGLHAAMRWL